MLLLFGFPLRVSRPQGLYFSRRGEVLPRRQGGRMSCFSRADEITRTVISPPSIFPKYWLYLAAAASAWRFVRPLYLCARRPLYMTSNVISAPAL